MLNRLTHQALQLACRRSDNAFRKESKLLEFVQRQKLAKILQQVAAANGRIKTAVPTWEEFAVNQPVTRYGQWQEAINAQRRGESLLTTSPLVRYQPTSGSSEKLKLIPYTKAFIDELDSAIAPWLASMYRHHRGLNGGTHYWSVSWLPQSQFAELSGNLNDDSELLGSVKRVLAGQSQAVPADVALAASADDALFATLCFLVANQDLRMLSVWSPTFALQLLEAIPVWAEQIIDVLSYGNWRQRATSLKNLKAPHAPKRAKELARVLRLHPSVLGAELWPNLALVSAWDTADAAPWAQQLKACFPQAAFEGKGLWATEGVVTIPIDGQYPLAYRSHVYEFEDLQNGGILAPWELKEGDIVSPIITSGNGLLRYQLDDRIAVDGFWGGVPCFKFMGRRFGVDLVGEKMSPEAARQVLASAANRFGLEPVTLMAVNGENQSRPRYIALFSSGKEQASYRVCAEASAWVERELRGHFHYELARDLRQLEPVIAVIAQDGWRICQDVAIAGGMIEGNIKPEPVRRVQRQAVQQILPELAFALVADSVLERAS
jgi:hypothetical protein